MEDSIRNIVYAKQLGDGEDICGIDVRQYNINSSSFEVFKFKISIIN